MLSSNDDGCCHVSEPPDVVADIYVAVAVDVSVVVLAGMIVAVTDVSVIGILVMTLLL
jgi:hypothetical protein